MHSRNYIDIELQSMTQFTQGLAVWPSVGPMFTLALLVGLGD